MRASDKDLYGVLEVTPGASEEVIAAAHRTLMKQFHPDLAQGEDQRRYFEEVSKDLNEARRVLSDPRLRAAYDRDRLYAAPVAVMPRTPAASPAVAVTAAAEPLGPKLGRWALRAAGAWLVGWLFLAAAYQGLMMLAHR